MDNTVNLTASAKPPAAPKPVTLDDVMKLLKEMQKEQLLQGERIDALQFRVGQSRKREIKMAQKFDDAYAAIIQELDETEEKVTKISNASDSAVATIQQLARMEADTKALLEEALKGVNLTPEQEAKFSAVKSRNDAFQQALNDKAEALAAAITSSGPGTSETTDTGTPSE